MYKISTITPKELSRIKIRNQDKIVELTGSKLDPMKAFEIIKKSSKEFSEINEKAKQADELFFELLKLNGISLESASKKSSNSNNAIRIQERERARSLQLLELKLQLVS